MEEEFCSDKIENKEYANGGTVEYVGLAKIHDHIQSDPCWISNADAQKLYDFIYSSPNLLNEVFNEKANCSDITPEVSKAIAYIDEQINLLRHPEKESKVDFISEAIEQYNKFIEQKCE